MMVVKRAKILVLVAADDEERARSTALAGLGVRCARCSQLRCSLVLLRESSGRKTQCIPSIKANQTTATFIRCSDLR